MIIPNEVDLIQELNFIIKYLSMSARVVKLLDMKFNKAQLILRGDFDKLLHKSTEHTRKIKKYTDRRLDHNCFWTDGIIPRSVYIKKSLKKVKNQRRRGIG